jgi:TfoX/Sxy family transcriptional regulator of competence genes
LEINYTFLRNAEEELARAEEPRMYNTKLEEKIDTAIQRWQSVEKKKLFGGVGYLLKGNMAFGIHKDSLIIRMDKGQGEQSLKDRNVRPFDITGRPMSGWIMVQEAGWRSAAGLAKWISMGKQYALSLPEKKRKTKKKTKTLREYKAS